MATKKERTKRVEPEMISDFPIFEGLSPEVLQEVADRMKVHEQPKYQYIYMADEPSAHVFFLIRGAIKIGTHSSDGREVIKSILHPRAVFGELCLVGEEYRQEFARCMNSGVQYYSLACDDLRSLIEQHPALSLNFLQTVGGRLRQAENRLESLVFKDARTRIIEFIKDSANKCGRRVGYEMLLKHCLTQQDIANLTGTSRQTVTSVLNDLKKSNLIYFNRNSILIRDLANLS
jgi:CRP/FNR family cyclic AMP-dependent transcriptional regulator